MKGENSLVLERKKQNNESDSSDGDGDVDTDDSESILRTNVIEQRVPTFRQNVAPKILLSKYESLDYEICDNELYENSNKFSETHSPARKDFARWIINILIGVLIAVVAFSTDITIRKISELKYEFLKSVVDDEMLAGNLYVPYLYFALTNAILVAFGAYLVTYIEPVAAGSGVPLVKSYLNGIKVPRVVRIKTLFVKVVGVITSVSGGLAGGKEGPMIQAGSVIAAGISQGKSTTFGIDFGILKYFRDDHEKRDFVVAGASAGVSAAFGAPIGGVLFALEEAVSFWNPNLILRTLIASIISSATLNILLTEYHGVRTLSFPGLFNLGQFEAMPYAYFEIPIFMLMGCFGGLSGALWNCCNTKLSIFRNRYITAKWAKVFEAVLVAILSATVACLMMFIINDCRPLGVDPTSHPVQLFCKDNEYNAAAALWLQTPEETVKALFHDPPGSHCALTLIVLFLVYFPLSFITYGISVSIGIFIPCLMVGATWGRLFSMLISTTFPHWPLMQPSKYALIGAAAQLGGSMRMIISLTVILMETTGNISFALPLILTFVCAKWSGDLFNEGIYDTQIAVSKVPILGWRVKRPYRCLKAANIMAQSPICIRLKDKVANVVDLLKTYPHNGFPVVDHIDENGNPGHFCGLILRSQLIVIIMQRYYDELKDQWGPDISIETFRNEYPRYQSIDLIPISKKNQKFTINLKMFMNRSAHSAWEMASVPKIFETFRALGLRHLVVVDEINNVKGIITRKDFL